MTEYQHDHARPDTADMRAALGTARAILDGADHRTVHEAAMTAGACPACVAAAGISFVITAVSTLVGDQAFVSEGTRRVLLAAVDAADTESCAPGRTRDSDPYRLQAWQADPSGSAQPGPATAPRAAPAPVRRAPTATPPKA